MKNIIMLLFTAIISLAGNAQSTIRPNIYYQDLSYYNTAAIPLADTQSASLSIYSKYRIVENEKQIWDKPPAFFLNYIGRLKNNLSFYNIAIVSDQYSFYSRNTVYAGYSHKFKIGSSDHRSINVGGRFVFNLDYINMDKFQSPTEKTGRALKPNGDMDLGAFYRSKNFSLGVSTKNMLGISVKSEGKKILTNQREFYVHTSYRFRIREKYEIEPYLLYRKELGSELDLGLHLGLVQWLDVAYQLRLIQLRHTFILQGHISKTWSVGVALDKSPLVTDKNIDAVIRYTF